MTCPILHREAAGVQARFRHPLSPRSAMRSPLAPLCCALAFAGLAAPSTAQSNAERVANDAYTRSHDYDLVHQRIELKGFDWDSTSFDGRVATTLVALRPGLDSVILDAGHLLGVRRVTDARGATLRTAARRVTRVPLSPRAPALPHTPRLTIPHP